MRSARDSEPNRLSTYLTKMSEPSRPRKRPWLGLVYPLLFIVALVVSVYADSIDKLFFLTFLVIYLPLAVDGVADFAHERALALSGLIRLLGGLCVCATAFFMAAYTQATNAPLAFTVFSLLFGVLALARLLVPLLQSGRPSNEP